MLYYQPESEAVQILGHEKLSMSYSVYSLGLSMDGLRGARGAVDNRSPVLDHKADKFYVWPAPPLLAMNGHCQDALGDLI